MKLLSAMAGIALGLVTPLSAHAGIVELDISASWTAADYDVSSTGPSVGATGVPQEDDDKVFGVAPSDGSINFTLLVDTSAVTSFNTGDFGVTHDWYGYSNVSLKNDVTFGSAIWSTADILTGLVGPNGITASLWTNSNLGAGIDPTLLSFRMFGSWEGSNADMFIGSRTATTISDSFLMWEYFGGEEIRSAGYSASVDPVPLPAGMMLMLTGLAGLGGARALRRRKSAG